jgi:nucleotide-binding universal stress UspA family protein
VSVLAARQGRLAMYTRAIVGVDGRVGGDEARALASRLIAPRGQVVLAHVSSGGHAPSSNDAEIVEVEARSVGEGLHRVAKREGGDVIVVGSSQRRALARVLAGDDARSVIHHAECPVAIAPSGYSPWSEEIGTVGVAYDGSPGSEVALAHGGLLAAQLGARLTALNVVAPRIPTVGVGMSGGYLIDHDSLLAEARAHLGTVSGVELRFVIGTIYAELTAFSERVGLVVCGSRQHHRAGRIAFGSSGNYLAHHAACPLLVTPMADEPTVTRWRDRCAAGFTRT